MERNFIHIKINKKDHYICTEDLWRMYYFKKVNTPVVPKFDGEIKESRETDMEASSEFQRCNNEIQID